MRRPKRREVLVAMAALVAVPIACSKVLGIEPAYERDADGGSLIEATAPPDDGGLPPLGDKDASCGDTTSDSKNCGVCGLDCRGAKCTSGRCEPSVFVFGLRRPSYLAVTNDAVYWTDALASGPGSGVRRCDLTGCQNGTPRTLYEKPDVTYAALAVDGDDVLALRASFGGIDVCKGLGCSGTPVNVNVPATSLTIASQKAHYTTPVQSGSAAPAPGLWRCEGIPYCQPRTHLSPQGATVRAVGADLYVIDRGPTNNDGVLFRCVGGNCASPQTLATGLTSVFPKFVASQHGVGWVAQGPSGIELFMCEAQSCAGGPKTLAKLGGYAESFAFDAKYLYWANNEYSTIERVAWASANAKPEVILTKQGLPTGIAMHQGELYFTRFEFGDIVRWVPPP